MTYPARPKAMMRRRSTVIGKHAEQDVPRNVKYSCATCSITYYLHETLPPFCPLCAATKEVDKLKDQLQKVANELRLVGQQYDAMATQLNNLEAMKQGLTLIAKDDLVWIKSVCYMHRQEPNSVVLTAQKTKHGWAFYLRGKNRPVPEEHVMTSIGGSSLAMAYAYTQKQSDNVKALELLMRAMAWHLANQEN